MIFYATQVLKDLIIEEMISLAYTQLEKSWNKR